MLPHEFIERFPPPSNPAPFPPIQKQNNLHVETHGLITSRSTPEVIHKRATQRLKSQSLTFLTLKAQPFIKVDKFNKFRTSVTAKLDKEYSGRNLTIYESEKNHTFTIPLNQIDEIRVGKATSLVINFFATQMNKKQVY